MITDELKALLDGATPGPWDIDPHGIDDCFGDVWFGEEARVCENASAADASLIAMAPALAAEVIALREREARLVEALRGIKADCLERAKFSRDGQTVPIGDGAWRGLCNAIAEIEKEAGDAP